MLRQSFAYQRSAIRSGSVWAQSNNCAGLSARGSSRAACLVGASITWQGAPVMGVHAPAATSPFHRPTSNTRSSLTDAMERMGSPCICVAMACGIWRHVSAPSRSTWGAQLMTTPVPAWADHERGERRRGELYSADRAGLGSQEIYGADDGSLNRALTRQFPTRRLCCQAFILPATSSTYCGIRCSAGKVAWTMIGAMNN